MVQSIATASEGSPCTFPGNLHPSRLDFIPLQICFACSRTSRKWSQIALSPKDPFTPHNAYEIHPCYYGCHICLSSLLSMGLRNFQKLWYISWTTQETPYSSGQKKKAKHRQHPRPQGTGRQVTCFDQWKHLLVWSLIQAPQPTREATATAPAGHRQAWSLQLTYRLLLWKADSEIKLDSMPTNLPEKTSGQRHII